MLYSRHILIFYLRVVPVNWPTEFELLHNEAVHVATNTFLILNLS